MIPRRQGRIINLASIAGLRGSATQKTVAYNTSKAAVVNLTRALAANGALTGSPSTRWRPACSPAR